MNFPTSPSWDMDPFPAKKSNQAFAKISSHALFKGEHQQSQVHHSNLSESKGVGFITPKKMAHFARGKKNQTRAPLSRVCCGSLWCKYQPENCTNRTSHSRLGYILLFFDPLNLHLRRHTWSYLYIRLGGHDCILGKKAKKCVSNSKLYNGNFTSTLFVWRFLFKKNGQKKKNHVQMMSS